MRWRFDLYIANIEILGTLNLWEQSNLFSQLWSGIIDLFSLLYEGTTNESLILFNSNSCSQVLMIYYNIVCGCCRVRFNLIRFRFLWSSLKDLLCLHFCNCYRLWFNLVRIRLFNETIFFIEWLWFNVFRLKSWAKVSWTYYYHCMKLLQSLVQSHYIQILPPDISECLFLFHSGQVAIDLCHKLFMDTKFGIILCEPHWDQDDFSVFVTSTNLVFSALIVT